MSQKWIRSKQWDDRHIPPALWPVKFVLRAFSSIPLAVCLLSCVALYGTLASVPAGLIALAPTYIVYGLTLVVVLAVVAAIPSRLVLNLMRKAGAGFGARFAAGLVLLIALGVGAVWVWYRGAWPALRYDAPTGQGLRFFGAFVDEHKATTIRRLRSMEMSELEFYGWWPLKVILGAFILNMVTATVRRIEFKFHNIGVLTVHTGIVTIAIGSIFYSRAKEEGDMLLLSGKPSKEGNPTPGPIESGFFDNTRPALWANMGPTAEWQQRPLAGLPRYHDYNLGAGLPAGVDGIDAGDMLSIPVEAQGGRERSIIDPDVTFRVVGYGAYVDLVPTWAPSGGPGGEPLRQIEFGRKGLPAGQKPFTIPFVPGLPAERVNSLGSSGAPVLSVEYTREMSEQRWADLRAALPPGIPDQPTLHALVIEVAGKQAAQVYAAEPGKVIPVGETGYVVQVRELLPQPPLPIITAGYEGAESSVAIVHVRPPGAGREFDRYVYHRFPEITQDLLDEKNEQGMPRRRDADPGIRISYIDASMTQVYFDEVGGPTAGNDPTVRAIVRAPGEQARVLTDLKTGDSIQIAQEAFLRLGERLSAARIERPRQVPEAKRDNKLLGTHQHAAIAVEVGSLKTPAWRSTVWLPFMQYLLADSDMQDLVRSVSLPDGRVVTLGFGRLRRQLPGIALQLADFDMTPYPGSETPRDYRSDVLVLRTAGESPPEMRYTSLNDPLLVRVPFQRRPDVPWIANEVGWLVSQIVPTQYKFSQAGWDQRGWTQSKQAADAGQLKRPFANFTILGVGNNPGIYVIASGAVMMSVGIPWAFYIKPLLVKARKRKIQKQVAAGTYAPPKVAKMNGVAGYQRSPGEHSAGAKT